MKKNNRSRRSKRHTAKHLVNFEGAIYSINYFLASSLCNDFTRVTFQNLLLPPKEAFHIQLNHH